MAIYKLYMLMFALKTATCSCNYEKRTSLFEEEKVEIKKEGILPICISENSGLVKAWQDGYYWTHNDGGGNPDLYMINIEGDVFDTLEIKTATNVDWEDLAKDNKGNIYIGDFGNNFNNRTDLTIYKKKSSSLEKITFKYEDQNFNNTKDRFYDCEAFFWANDSLYLFTKSWKKGHKLTKMYVLPDLPGNYTLKPKASIVLKTQVTSADISPDGTKFALLTYGKIFIFGIENHKINFDKPLRCIKIGKNQTEAIVFENDHKIVFSNEQRKIYSIKI
jgi:hypothetical protein